MESEEAVEGGALKSEGRRWRGVRWRPSCGVYNSLQSNIVAVIPAFIYMHFLIIRTYFYNWGEPERAPH